MNTLDIGIIVGSSIAGFIILAIIVVVLKRRNSSYSDVDERAAVSQKMWVGPNPTDRPDDSSSPNLTGEEPADEKQRKRLFTKAENFLRSCKEPKEVDRHCYNMGHRQCKLYSLLSTKSGDKAVMSLINLDMHRVPIHLPDYNNAKHADRLCKLLLAIRHPYILETLEASFSYEKTAFVVVRPYSSEGSLRDLIHEVRDPAKQFRQKYIPQTAEHKHSGRPLSKQLIVKYGRMILEALKVLQDLQIPYFHAHTGNVIIQNNVCRLTDYENAFFGLKHRAWSRMHKLPQNPTVVSFAFILYEMSTAQEMEVDAATKSMDYRIDDPNYKDVEEVLENIFNKNPTLEELLEHKMFQAKVKTDDPEQSPDLADSKISRLTSSVFQYYKEVIFPKSEGIPTISIKDSEPVVASPVISPTVAPPVEDENPSPSRLPRKNSVRGSFSKPAAAAPVQQPAKNEERKTTRSSSRRSIRIDIHDDS